MNIFGSKSGHLNNSKNCKVFFIFPKFLPYLMIFSEFCCTFGTLHFEKSSNTAKNFEKMKKNLPIILLLKMASFGTKSVHSALQNNVSRRATFVSDSLFEGIKICEEG